MSIRKWFHTPRLRRGIAAGSIVLAAGGMVLLRSSAGARTTTAHGSGVSSTAFSGSGINGKLSLSETHVLAGGERRLFAELTLVADDARMAPARAPLSLVVVLDTSGSMMGEKIAQAKRAVIRLVRDMRREDQIAL